MCFSTFNYLASVQNVLVILKCGCGVCFIKLIENILAKAVANLSMSNSVTKQLSCKAYFETKQRYFSHQSKIHDKIAVISVKIFCQPKYFLVTRKPRYTIISTSGRNIAISPEPKLRWTSDQSVILSLSIVVQKKKNRALYLYWLNHGGPRKFENTFFEIAKMRFLTIFVNF